MSGRPGVEVTPLSPAFDFLAQEYKVPKLLLAIDDPTFADALDFLSKFPEAQDCKKRIETLATVVREECELMDEGLWALSELAETAFKNRFGRARIVAAVERALKFYEDFVVYHRASKERTKAWETHVTICMDAVSDTTSQYNSMFDSLARGGKIPLKKRRMVARWLSILRRSTTGPMQGARDSLDMTGKNRRILNKEMQFLTIDLGIFASLLVKISATVNGPGFDPESLSLPAWDEYQTLCQFVSGIKFDGTHDQSTSRGTRGPFHYSGNEATIARECSATYLAFHNSDAVGRWRQAGYETISTLFSGMEAGRDVFGGGNFKAGQLLAFLLLQLYKLEQYEHIAFIGLLSILCFRRAHEQCPTAASTFNLICALGALSVGVQCDQAVAPEALQLVDEAIELARLLPTEETVRRRAVLASLYYSRALVLRHINPYVTEPELLTLRRALRGALAAVTMARSARGALSWDSKPPARLARALTTAAKFGRQVLEEMETFQSQHHGCLAAQYDFACPEAGNPTQAQLLHSLASDSSLGTRDSFACLAEEAVQLLRTQVDYKASLLDALCVAIELFEPGTDQVAPLYIEALQISDRRLGDFPTMVQPDRAKLVVNISQGIQASKSRFQTVDLLRRCIQGLQRLDIDHVDDEQELRHVSLCVSLTLALAHLERYDEAITRAEAISLASLDGRSAAAAGLKVSATIAYCLWLKGDAQASLEKLEDGLRECTGSEEGGTGADYSKLRDPTHLLMFGWLGAVKASLGEPEEGLLIGQIAVAQMRSVLQQLADENSKLAAAGEKTSIWKSAQEALDPVDTILPQLLLYQAAALSQLGRPEEAAPALEEAVITVDREGKVDQSTVKTALLLKARLLERSGEFAEALVLRARADAIPLQGFNSRLGCFTVSASESIRSSP
ncbi:hypothetical protein V8E36_009763 [Tilletia maclaganii]